MLNSHNALPLSTDQNQINSRYSKDRLEPKSRDKENTKPPPLATSKPCAVSSNCGRKLNLRLIDSDIFTLTRRPIGGKLVDYNRVCFLTFLLRVGDNFRGLAGRTGALDAGDKASEHRRDV